MKKRSLFWVATVYAGQSMPYALISVVAAIFLKNFHISNERITFSTSLLLLPWTLKPLWAPYFETGFTKKTWLVTLQFTEAILLACIALSLFIHSFFYYSLLFLGLIALCSASYDIVSDGFYMLRLNTSDQYFFVGIRTLFYQFAKLFVQGLLMIFIGQIALRYSITSSWQCFFLILALITFTLALWHKRFLLDPEKDQPRLTTASLFFHFQKAFRSFITMHQVIPVTLFLFLYDMTQAQYFKILPLFLLDTPIQGGLGLTTSEVGFVYGTLSSMAMITGVLLGGVIVNQMRLQPAIKWLTLCMTISTVSYCFLGYCSHSSLVWIFILTSVPQFFYGLANSAYMSFLLTIVTPLPYRTTCYAIGTAVMSLGHLVFGASSGFIQQSFGYLHFFILLFFINFGIYIFTLWTLPRLKIS